MWCNVVWFCVVWCGVMLCGVVWFWLGRVVGWGGVRWSRVG